MAINTTGIDWQQLYNQEPQQPQSGGIFEEGSTRPYSPLTYDMMAKNVVSGYDDRVEQVKSDQEYVGNLFEGGMQWHGFQSDKHDADFIHRLWNEETGEGRRLLEEKFPELANPESQTWKDIQPFLEGDRVNPNKLFRDRGKKAVPGKEAVYGEQELISEAVKEQKFTSDWFGREGKAQQEINEIYNIYGKGKDADFDFLTEAEKSGYFEGKDYGQKELLELRNYQPEVKEFIDAEYFDAESARQYWGEQYESIVDQISQSGSFLEGDLANNQSLLDAAWRDHFDKLGEPYGWGNTEMQQLLKSTNKNPYTGEKLMRAEGYEEILAPPTGPAPDLTRISAKPAVYGDAPLLQAAVPAEAAVPPSGEVPGLLKSVSGYGGETASVLGEQALVDQSLSASAADIGVEGAGLLETMGGKAVLGPLLLLAGLGYGMSRPNTSIGQMFN